MTPNGYSPLQDELLKLQAGGTFTATGNSAALDLGNGYAPGGGGWPAQVAVKVTAVKTSAGNEAYAFRFQDSPDGATWTDRTPAVAAQAVDTFVLAGFVLAQFVRLAWTIAGTAPTVTIADAYLNPQTNG